MDEEVIESLKLADYEIENDDFVTLYRTTRKGIVEERLLTFSGIYITRYQYAGDATSIKESERHSQESDAVSS